MGFQLFVVAQACGHQEWVFMLFEACYKLPDGVRFAWFGSGGGGIGDWGNCMHRTAHVFWG